MDIKLLAIKLLLISLTCFCISYLIIIPIVKKYRYLIKKILKNKNIKLLLTTILLITLLLTIITLNLYKSMALSKKDFLYIGIIFILMIVIILMKIKEIYKLNAWNEKKITLENAYYMQLKHYEKYTNNYNKYRKFKHDIKNYLIIIDELINRKEYGKVKKYLEIIKEELNDINVVNYTNNIIIDSVLCNINEICQIKSIDFKIIVNVNNTNKEILNFIEFLICSLHNFILIVEKVEHNREIICEIKSNERNLLLCLKTTSINSYNKLLIEDIKEELKEKGKNLNLMVEFKNNNSFELRCLF